MVKVKYVPRQEMFDDYYLQRGGKYPVFQGSLIQRGHGLGKILGSLGSKVIMPVLKNSVVPMVKEGVKRMLPLVKSGASKLGKQALTSGARAASDILKRKRTAKSAIEKERDVLRQTLAEFLSPVAKRKYALPDTSLQSRVQKRASSPDIFQ